MEWVSPGGRKCQLKLARGGYSLSAPAAPPCGAPSARGSPPTKDSIRRQHSRRAARSVRGPPAAYKNTYDFLVENEGYGKPDTRRLPYDDYGVVLAQAVSAGGSRQTVQTASYGANRLGLDVGEFVHVGPGTANEEYVQVVAADPDNQTFDAIFTKDHAAGERVRPTIWPTPILREGDALAFDILSVASPDPGSDLTVVIQT